MISDILLLNNITNFRILKKNFVFDQFPSDFDVIKVRKYKLITLNK